MMHSFRDLSHSALSHLGLVTKQWQAFKRTTFPCERPTKTPFSIGCFPLFLEHMCGHCIGHQDGVSFNFLLDFNCAICAICTKICVTLSVDHKDQGAGKTNAVAVPSSNSGAPSLPLGHCGRTLDGPSVLL